MIVRRVGPLSFAKITGVLYGLLGFLFGAIFSVISLVSHAFAAKDAGPMGLVFGAGAVVALPIFYGVMGFVTSHIGAALYNVIAGWVGGIELDVQ
jgi:hypothetical protein